MQQNLSGGVEAAPCGQAQAYVQQSMLGADTRSLVSALAVGLDGLAADAQVECDVADGRAVQRLRADLRFAPDSSVCAFRMWEMALGKTAQASARFAGP